MRVYRPDTDQSFDVVVYVNSIIADEYYLPDIDSTPPFVDTYIPVEAGDRITFKWTLTGSGLHAQVDLICDGTFAKTNRMDGNADGSLKHFKRTAKFDTALNCPKPPGWTSIQPPSDVFEGEMVVTKLPDGVEEEVGGGRRPGVGSLELVVSVNQHPRENYDDPPASMEFGTWKERMEKEAVRLAEISPEFHIELKLQSEARIASKRAKSHRDKWQQTRFGKQAWGKCVFYYRSLEAIRRAGCVQREDDEWCTLPPWDGEKDFVCADVVKKPVTRKKTVIQPRSDDGTTFIGQANSSESEEQVREPTPEKKATPRKKVTPKPAERIIKQEQEDVSEMMREPSPKPKKKKKGRKLGGALFAPSPPPDDEDIPAPTIEGRHEEGSDVDPTDEELAAARPDSDHEDTNPQMEEPPSGASGKFSNYFDEQSSDESEAAPAPAENDTAAADPPKWDWPDTMSESPTKPPQKQPLDLNDIWKNANKSKPSPPIDSLQTPPLPTLNETATNAAPNLNLNDTAAPEHSIHRTPSPAKPTTPMALFFDTPTMPDSPSIDPVLDKIRIPTMIEIVNAIAEWPNGAEPSVLGQLFTDNGPYGDTVAAQQAFKTLVGTVVHRRTDNGKYYLQSETVKQAGYSGGIGALLKEVNDEGVVKRGKAPGKEVEEEVQKKKAKAMIKAGNNEEGGGQKKGKEKEEHKRKAAPPVLPNKRLRTDTPTSGGGGERKKKLAQLKKDLREKQERAKALEERKKARMAEEEAEIEELERLNAEADEQLASLAMSSEDGDEDAEED